MLLGEAADAVSPSALDGQLRVSAAEPGGYTGSLTPWRAVGALVEVDDIAGLKLQQSSNWWEDPGHGSGRVFQHDWNAVLDTFADELS